MATSESNFFSRNRIWLLVCVLLILLAFSIYLWKQHELNELREAQALKEQLLVDKANSLIDENDAQLLRSLMQPLGWAIRSEMLQEDYEQIDNYLRQFIQQPQFQLALVANARDSVILSTNQKHIGKPISQFFPEKYFRGAELATYTIDSTHMLVVAPIMGYTNRMGTLMLTYEQQRQLSLPAADSL